ncbi:MAG: ATP phosphoribosyltransferase regulatory subunit [Rhodospirillaceae bacterium]
MMSEPLHHALLPEGLPDVLPPDADHEAALVARLMAVFASHGYDRVKPPLLEFEDSLFTGIGAAVKQNSFRVVDPKSGMSMGIRADMTPQVARIATTRLVHAPRPLRLAYAGQVLRVSGGQLRGERQFGQVGAELIGAFEPEADAEIILLAAGALGELGITGLSVDLCVPTLVPTLCRAWGLDGETAARLREALDRKDAAGVAVEGGAPAATLARLMAAAGQADRTLKALESIDLPPEAAPDRRRLAEVVRLIHAAAPDLSVTVDLVEYRGFEYQTGVSFTLFARGVRGELGSGGRYRAGKAVQADGSVGEGATGVTLYSDTVLRAVPSPALRQRVYLPRGSDRGQGEQLRNEGWITVAGLVPVENAEAEAIRLGCSHVLIDGKPRPVGRT